MLSVNCYGPNWCISSRVLTNLIRRVNGVDRRFAKSFVQTSSDRSIGVTRMQQKAKHGGVLRRVMAESVIATICAGMMRRLDGASIKFALR